MSLSWYAIIRLENGNQQQVEVEADNQFSARQMLEALYGHGAIISGPHRVDLMRAR
jgi:hypothetical protein